MKLFRPKYPYLLRLLYPERVSTVKNSHAIYLTFDDGPIPEVTPWVLDLLKKHDAKATFFCIGDNVQKHPDIFRRIIEEGHAVGNHTFNHLKGWKTSRSEYIENIRMSDKVMVSEASQRNNKEDNISAETQAKKPEFPLFRPPYGKIKNSQAKLAQQEGFKVVMWDVISGDYNKDFSAEECYRNVTENAKAGSTIVFHDSQKAFVNLREILPKVLEYYKEKEYDFRSLKDVL